MSNYDYYRIGVDVATLILIPLCGLLFKTLRTMRTNDMVHIDEKLDSINKVSMRTEEKLDRHIEWHLSQKG